MLVGFFKKIFVADNCAILANYAFNPQTSLNGYWAVIGVVAFAFQIYADFSGYTDIARGSAKLLGIDLMENFKFPYFSRTPSEFWGRWHISLSTWFRDYLYIPLGGNRGARWETLRNLAIVMLLAGLWHGANWVFVLWGAYHGALLILYRVLPPFNRIQAKDGAWTWRDVAGGAPDAGLHPGGLGHFPQPQRLPSGRLVRGPGQLEPGLGALLAILLPLAADPYPPLDSAPGPDLEIPG